MQLTNINASDVSLFIGEPCRRHYEPDPPTPDSYKGIYIQTLEGTMLASVGDYIIKGVKGEFYPCKPDIFEATYEKV